MPVPKSVNSGQYQSLSSCGDALVRIKWIDSETLKPYVNMKSFPIGLKKKLTNFIFKQFQVYRKIEKYRVPIEALNCLCSFHFY